MDKILTPLILISILASCGTTQDPPPIPVAGFFFETEVDSRGGPIAEITETVVIRNESTGAVQFHWDFGDGNISTLENPTHKFQALGTYNVRLTAINAVGDSSSMDKILRIGGRAFRNLVVNKLSNFKPNGEPWDPVTPPDLLFFFGEVDNIDNSYLLQFRPDTPLDRVPFGGDIDFGVNLFLTDTRWFFILIDNDAPMDEFDANDEFMFGIELNPTQVGIRSLPDEFGRFQLKEGLDMNGDTNTDFEMAITWDIKLSL